MSESSTSKDKKKRHLKIALIPILIVVLILVLVWPASEESLQADSESTGQAKTEPLNANEFADDQIEQISTTIKERSLRVWPEISLANILKHDPFALEPLMANYDVAPKPEVQPQDVETTEVSVQDERAERRKRLQERIAILRTKHVSAVFRNKAGTAAIIDSKIFQEGDLLEDGVRIVKITSPRAPARIVV